MEQAVKKSFVTLFPLAENIHLYKEIGMIPYYMNREFGYDAYVACYEDREKLSYLDEDLSSIGHLKVDKRFESETLNSMLFLWKFRNKIHTLMMIHISLRKVFLMLFLKTITFFRAKVYIKMDANPKYFNLGFEKKNLSNVLRIKLYNLFDLVSVETKDLFNYFDRCTCLNVKYVPNGFTDLFLDKNIPTKDNVILTVARLDDPIKNISLLMKAFCNAKMQNWRMVLIGPYDENFKTSYNELIKSTPHVAGKIDLVGPIYDRKKLNDYYSKAKVFALTSNSESFGFVYLEAISNGCFVISTDLPSAKDITNNGEFGRLFPIGNESELISILKEIDKNDIITDNLIAVRKFAFDSFSWQSVVKKINLGLSNL